MKKIKDSELKNILAEVEQELATLLKSEANELRKAAEGDEGGEEGSAPAEASDTGSEDAPAAASAPEAAPAEGSAPAAEGSAPEATDEASAPDASMDPAAEQSPATPEMLQAEYAKLPPEELKMHYLAAKAALFAVMGADDSAPAEGSAPAAPPAPEMSAAPAGAAPAGPEASPAAALPPPAAPEASPAQDPSMAMKSEKLNAELATLKKSEESSSSKIKELESMVEGMAKALDLALGQPMRKAQTRMNYVPKTEEQPVVKTLSKSEAETHLVSLVKSGKLNQQQKERVISFSLGNTTQEQIKDLLEIK